MKEYKRFEDLPILIADEEYKNGWRRTFKKEGTIADLLDIWDIDDDENMSEMAQVLRYLKKYVEAQSSLRALVAAVHCRMKFGPIITESTAMALIKECEKEIPALSTIKAP
jgi:hypothetical protein